MIRVYLKDNAVPSHQPSQSFEVANKWTLTEDWGLNLWRIDDTSKDSALIAVFPPGSWVSVVDADLVESKFPHPPTLTKVGLEIE